MINMAIDNMSKDEKSLLLYLESRVVDNGGQVDTRHMNAEDRKIASRWRDCGFICYGRIPFIMIKNNSTHFVILSNKAWLLASECRKARGLRSEKALREALEI